MSVATPVQRRQQHNDVERTNPDIPTRKAIRTVDSISNQVSANTKENKIRIKCEWDWWHHLAESMCMVFRKQSGHCCYCELPATLYAFSGFACIASSNCPANEFAALNQKNTRPAKMTARYGVDAARLPTLKIKTCCISAPPLFPSGLPTTSMAAFPLVLES